MHTASIRNVWTLGFCRITPARTADTTSLVSSRSQDINCFASKASFASNLCFGFFLRAKKGKFRCRLPRSWKPSAQPPAASHPPRSLPRKGAQSWTGDGLPHTDHHGFPRQPHHRFNSGPAPRAEPLPFPILLHPRVPCPPPGPQSKPPPLRSGASRPRLPTNAYF